MWSPRAGVLDSESSETDNDTLRYSKDQVHNFSERLKAREQEVREPRPCHGAYSRVNSFSLAERF